jgi:hypothetical protein
MRAIGMVLLLLTLAGCTGDRTKQGMNSTEERQQRVASRSVAPILRAAA